MQLMRQNCSFWFTADFQSHNKNLALCSSSHSAAICPPESDCAKRPARARNDNTSFPGSGGEATLKHTMELEWDADKAAQNLKKHGVCFEDAEERKQYREANS